MPHRPWSPKRLVVIRNPYQTTIYVGGEDVTPKTGTPLEPGDALFFFEDEIEHSSLLECGVPRLVNAQGKQVRGDIFEQFLR
jgi:hypothetical protein